MQMKRERHTFKWVFLSSRGHVDACNGWSTSQCVSLCVSLCVCVCLCVCLCVSVGAKVFPSVQITLKPMCCFTSALPLKSSLLVPLGCCTCSEKITKLSLPLGWTEMCACGWVQRVLGGGIYSCLPV